MSLERLTARFGAEVARLKRDGASKSDEQVITGVVPASGDSGPRYRLAGHGERAFLRFNANAYLGLGLHPDVVRAETEAAERFGTGPGAVRFISGTFGPHVALERDLAAFHGREAALIMSAAYTTMLGVLPQLVDERTLVISDALNHNCIINAIRLAGAGEKAIYPHLDTAELDRILQAGRGRFERACVVTDGVFSMRGDHAPLGDIVAACQRHEDAYPEGIVTVLDDSHGIGAFGGSGRGTEEVTGARADVLIATLGKALGVNGGYVVASRSVIDYLRETAPLYVYSNPITPAEAAAACAALAILAAPEGRARLRHLLDMAARLRAGVRACGFETLAGAHPIVPVLTRDSAATVRLVRHLFDHDVLATGLSYPVVPHGDEEIRLQVSADHTRADIDHVIDALRRF